MDLKRIISTFTYRIEAKPEGGFVAHASDPGLPPLEALTRQELQQKIQANIGAVLAAEFPGFPAGNLSSGTKELKFDFHIEAKPGGGFSLHSSDAMAAPIEGDSHEELAHPLAERLAAIVGEHLLPKELSELLAKQAASGDVQVFVNQKTSFTTNAGFHKTAFNKRQDVEPSGTLQPQTGGALLSAGDSSPITGETSKSWPIVRFLLTLLVVAALMYFFLRR